LGHFSVDKTVERIEHIYWFRRVRHTVKKYIKNCINCIYYKMKGGPKEGELYPLPKYAQPFHTLHVDHLGPFVKSKHGNRYLLVMVDSFTKFVFISAVKTTNSAEVISELDQVYKTFGNPRRIISDAGTAFTSKDFTQYCINKNIRLHTVATGMPRSNGQAERFNKTILEAMRTLGANSDEDCWDQCVTIVQQGLNSTIHKTTKAIPSEVFFGYRLRTDGDNIMGSGLDNGELIDVTDLRKNVDHNIKANAISQKKRFDHSRTKAREYSVVT
jgi:transposase InsO family protein